MPTQTSSPIYGLLAEYEDPEQLVTAGRQARELGYRRMEAYTPFPIEGMAEIVGVHGKRLPRIVLAGGILGATGGLLMQWYSATIAYPWNVGGRPYASWPAFIPIAFELTILLAALSAVFGMLWLNGLPQPYHPVFNVPGFATASRDRFFLCIEAADPKFDYAETRRFLEGTGARVISDVAP